MAFNFNTLPVEVLQIICGYLNTLDLLNLFTVEPRINELSSQLFRKAYFSSDQQVPIKLFNSISRTRFSECLTVFDITSIYWIPADDIRQCISTMRNLESFYAIDTKVELSEHDIITYNSLPKLKKLGVSVVTPDLYGNGEHTIVNLPKITHLYVHFDYAVGKHVKKMLEVFVRMQTIEELWLVEVGMHGDSSIVFGGLPLDGLQRFFVSPMMIDDYALFGNKTKIFSTNHYEERQSYYDKAYMGRGDLHLLQGLEESNWQSFLEIGPFSFTQAKKLFDGEQISTMKFDEINLVHDMMCNINYERMVANVILSENMKNLKKLSLNYCCYLSKPSRIDERSMLERIVENSPFIEELELWSCPRAKNNPEMADAAFEAIAKLKHLKRLVLDDVFSNVEGSFLKTVCKDCPNLKSLSITSFSKHNILHTNVCEALELVTQLEDFSYQVPGSSYDSLFESLSKNDRLNLRRLYIESKIEHKLDVNIFRNFLIEHPQLQFLQIVGNGPKLKIEMLDSSVREFRTDGWRYVAVSKAPWQYKHDVPLVHYYEMIKHFPKVSTIDTLRDYKI